MPQCFQFNGSCENLKGIVRDNESFHLSDADEGLLLIATAPEGNRGAQQWGAAPGRGRAGGCAVQQTERRAGKGEREEMGKEIPHGFGQCEFCMVQTENYDL